MRGPDAGVHGERTHALCGSFDAPSTSGRLHATTATKSPLPPVAATPLPLFYLPILTAPPPPPLVSPRLQVCYPPYRTVQLGHYCLPDPQNALDTFSTVATAFGAVGASTDGQMTIDVTAPIPPSPTHIHPPSPRPVPSRPSAGFDARLLVSARRTCTRCARRSPPRRTSCGRT